MPKEQIAPNRAEQVVALAGDWHGATQWALHAMDMVAVRGVRVILHLGDFGVWPGHEGRRYLQVLDEHARLNGLVVLVTPGNHEWWTALVGPVAETAVDRGDGWGPVIWLQPRIGVLTRGSRFEIELADEHGHDAGSHISFVSLGGAPSVDFDMRTRGRDWWAEEAISLEDVERTVAGGHADVMLAHDSPDRPFVTPKVGRILDDRDPEVGEGWGWSDRALAYAAVGRERMTEAFLGVKPRLFAHGHYHVSSEAEVQIPGADHSTRTWSLSAGNTAGNIRYLDLRTLADPEWATR